MVSRSNWTDLFHGQACDPLRRRVLCGFEPLKVSFVIAIAVGQEINQQLNQPAVLTSCFEMVRAPRTLFVAVKKVGSGQQPDVSYNVLTTQTQNLR